MGEWRTREIKKCVNGDESLCRGNNTSQEFIESGQLSDKFINIKNHSKHAGTDYESYTK